MNHLLSQYKEIASASLDSAKSLPFGAYINESVFNLEVEKIFHKEWIFVCAEQAMKNSGDYFAFDLAGESVVIIKGKDGALQAMSNNCRHRGTPLLDTGFGHIANNIVCPYHAWTYDDKGEFKGAPFPGKVKIKKEQHCLPQFKLETWFGLLFINLDKGAAPLADKLKGIEVYTSIYKPERFEMYTPGLTEFWDANWKLAMENALEGYHVFKVHKDTLETVGPSKLSYYVAGSSKWTITGGASENASGKLAKWFRGSYPEAYNHYQVIILPPSFVAILNYDSLSWIHVLPDGKGKSEICSGSLSPKSMFKEDKQSKAFTEAFFAEDKWICERVQKGMHSKLGLGGKLVEMELSVVDFHQYLSSRLFDTAVDDFFEDENAKRFKIE
ncbi:aromatic ring-hydroxylating oxygenase subunit alpha [Pseudoalteromonas denitrificans]|uniref:Ring hydroxylating alpha subunit (Catalytic domain) n=1 Tax=Pseudoalteromonas denitrificans DSM 6059 TaxID=1123010 RepID=A0A1I1KCG3_9GAMM|nr:aromatic ring-hydroxylating dioxygenase subunit alpha [Pseudoalteromonas denitrificans]SFC58466.1 Ring hydroxylating alpha subunit (catalytic domain) [Pseudoalteromonas denitrificans DSM 6059]